MPLRGLEFRRPLQAAVWTEDLHAQFRVVVPVLDKDRVLSTDIAKSVAFIQQYIQHD